MSSEHRNFVEAFRGVADPVLERYPELRFAWESHPKGGGYTSRVCKTANTGFDAGVEVQTYGLYPFAGEWHGSPWDITTPGTTVRAMCGYALGLIRALLSSDMRLRVRYAGGRPYKWCMEVASPAGWRLHEETGLLFFRYWSARSDECFQNELLPPLGFADGTAGLDSFATVWA
jgi:hypothetical protein